MTTINYNATNVTSYGTNVFAQTGGNSSDSGITLNIGNNVTNIPASAFSVSDSANITAPKLKNVTIGTGVTTIGTSAFNRCPFTSVTIPSSVTSIEASAFNSCEYLETVTFLNSEVPNS